MRKPQENFTQANTHLQNSNIVYKFFSARPRPSLHIRDLPTIARNLHNDLYTAYAAGNLTRVEPHLCPSFLTNLKASLQKRPQNHFYTFNIVRHLSKPRLMSVRGAQAPGSLGGTSKEECNGALQAVVRLHTLQRAREMRRKQIRGPQGGLMVVEEAVGEERETEQVDYFVVQRLLKRSRYLPWKVFGHAKPTTLTEVEREEEKKRGGRLTGRN